MIEKAFLAVNERESAAEQMFLYLSERVSRQLFHLLKAARDLEGCQLFATPGFKRSLVQIAAHHQVRHWDLAPHRVRLADYGRFGYPRLLHQKLLDLARV